MKTRWNKKLVEETIDRIIKATTIPERRRAVAADLKAELVEAIKAAQPPGFAEAVKKYPKGWFRSVERVYIGWHVAKTLAGLPNGAIFRDQDVCLDDPVYTAEHGHGLTRGRIEEIVESAARRLQPIDEEETALRAELHALIASHHTVEAMAKAVPDLAQYLPESAAPKTMAVTVLPSNALAALQKAGMQMVAAE